MSTLQLPTQVFYAAVLKWYKFALCFTLVQDDHVFSLCAFRECVINSPTPALPRCTDRACPGRLGPCVVSHPTLSSRLLLPTGIDWLRR